jgi:hypothetical protein
LGEQAFDRVLVPEMPFASPGPDVIQDEAPEDVERLSWISEASSVVGEVSRGILLPFEDRFSKEYERPVDVELLRSFPLLPYSLVGFPSFECTGAFEQAVLWGFLLIVFANLAMRGDSHTLEPSSHQESLIESDPNEGAYFPRA